MDDLKPCPFCGSDPMPEFYSSEGGTGYAIHCQAEACPAWPSAHGENEEEAIAAWNTRAPDPRLAEVEAERDAYFLVLQEIKAEGSHNHNTRCRKWWHAVCAALGANP